jgi:hypothetical protein
MGEVALLVYHYWFTTEISINNYTIILCYWNWNLANINNN